MFEYHIIHHVHGRIRVKVPWMKRLTLSQLAELSAIPLDRGILDIRPSWLTGSLVIFYDPKEINIMEHLKTLASNPKIESILGTPRSNGPFFPSHGSGIKRRTSQPLKKGRLHEGCLLRETTHEEKEKFRWKASKEKEWKS